MDNTVLNEGVGGDVIATDDIGGVKHQKVKIEYGDSDSATQVSPSNPLPVTDANVLTDEQLRADPVEVDTGLDQPLTNTELRASNVPVYLGDSGNLDAFSRVRISSPTTLFSVQCQYNTNALQMEGGATGTGTAPAHDANTRMVLLTASAGTGVSFFQSFQYVAYQPGKSHMIFMTGLFGAGVAGAVVDAGYFDLSNGIFYRQNGASGLQFVRRTKTSGSVVDNAVSQASWNLDKLDGTGVSGITLDETKVFILVIDLQFLGMGRVRIGFDIDGTVVYAHEFLNANVLTVSYMQTATLPVQMLLTATATGGTKNCYFKCASVSSEGGVSEDFSYLFSIPEVTVTAGNGTRTHLLSIRPKTTFNSITNRIEFNLDSLNIAVTGANPVFWELVIGQAITSPSYADVNSTYSGFEYTNAGTLSGSPIVVIMSGYIQAGASFKDKIALPIDSRYPITLDRAGAVRAAGTLTLLVTGLTGTSATRASINISEVR